MIQATFTFLSMAKGYAGSAVEQRGWVRECDSVYSMCVYLCDQSLLRL